MKIHISRLLVYILSILAIIHCGSQPEAISGKSCQSQTCEEGYACVNAHCVKNCAVKSDCENDMVCGNFGYCIANIRTQNESGPIGDPSVLGYEVSPAKQEVHIQNHKPYTLQFVLYARGSQKDPILNVQWKIDPKNKINIESDGKITLDGSAAGEFTISAFAPDLKGSAKLIVKTTETTYGDGVTAESENLFPINPFSSTTTIVYSGSVDLAYPDNQVILPRNINPMVFQWNAVSGAILYRLSIGGTISSLSLITTQTEGQFSDRPWSVLSESEISKPLYWMVEAVLADSKTLFGSAKQTLTFSNDRLQGSIYYWSVDTENIMKFRMGEDAPIPLFNKDGYPDVPLATKKQVKCTGCHTIAPDGSTMALTFEGRNYDGRRTGIIDVKTPYSPLIDPAQEKFYSRFQSFSPDSKYLAINADTYNNIDIIEVATANVMSNIVTGPATQPKWSADGKMIAYIEIHSKQNGDITHNEGYNRSDMRLATLSGLQSVDDTLLVSGGNEAVSDPDFSPDSKCIIFRRSPSGNIRKGNTKLYLYSLADQVEIELVNLANNGNMHDFWPSFSPFPENDYYWVVFFSRRKYGNKLEEGQKQLWIAPIDKQVIAGKDPSHPAFWLHGQDMNTGNMKGQWAVDFCLTEGEKCQNGGSGKTCCDKLECLPATMADTADQEIVYECQYPVNPSACLQKGETCTLDGAKCCEPYACEATSMVDTDLYNVARKCN